MNGFDWLLIVLIALGVAAALRHRQRHPGCGGNCAQCASRCKK
ncbi:MAG: hypothetical protein RSF90_04410 [Pygmaiobacter sp.]